jgi:hypothetical protein
MRINEFSLKSVLKAAVAAAAILLLSAGTSFGQQQINLTAGPTATTLPDGTTVPMWGYSCGAPVVVGGAASTASCAALNPYAAGGSLGGVIVTNGGSGYTTAPSVTIAAPTTGTQAMAVANISNGKVVSITLTNVGTGYTYPPLVTIGAPTSGTAASAAAQPAWSPVQITIPTGQPLQINLTNNLLFAPPSGPANAIPTSIVIIGQVGGGLGQLNQRTTTTTPPDHSSAQSDVTWFIAHTGAQGTPPNQSNRVVSMATEAEAVAPTATATCTATTPATGGCATLTWSALKPGTYLLESGTHPSIQVPMGLHGILVVTKAPAGTTAGTAYPTTPAVTYGGEVSAEFSEIDPVQNAAVDTAVRTAGFSETATMGTYSGTSISHVNVANGGLGYTAATLSVTALGGGGTGFAGTAYVDLSDPTSPTYQQVVSIVVNKPGSGYTGGIPSISIPAPPCTIDGVSCIAATGQAELALGTNELGHCGEGLSTPAAACYPPAVNYTPFYYLINGVAFDKTHPSLSLFPISSGTSTVAPITGNILVRLVNAGLRMHVPSIVGSQTTGYNGSGATNPTANGFTLIAEDGNVLPGVAPAGAASAPYAPRVQHHVFMAAGKTFDVLINAPASGAPALPIYDRELSLSGNSSARDAGMLAYIGVNGAALPAGAAGASGTGVLAMANPDSYNSLACPSTAASCPPIVVSDVSKGVIGNDVNVYGVALAVAPTNGTVTLASNGTFTYTSNPGVTSDTFWYCANGAALPTGTLPTPPATTTGGSCASVSFGASTLTGLPTAGSGSFTSKLSNFIKIPPPGVLAFSSDGNTPSLPLQVVVSSVSPASGLTVQMDADGGFTASLTGANTTGAAANFSYTVQNSLGVQSTSSGTITVNFPAPSNVQVKVVDAQQYSNCNLDPTCISGLSPITDYRWIIEEDETFWVDPNCTTNSSTTTPGCPAVVSAGGTIPTFGVQFHTSAMNFVAQGCTGTLSCEGGQTMYDNRQTIPNPSGPGTISNPTYGQHIAAVCDLGNGACRPDTTNTGLTHTMPGSVALDPSKRYFISVLPGDAANPFNTGNASGPGAGIGTGCNPTPTTSCPSTGHTMSGAPIPAACNKLGGPNACTTSSSFANTQVIVKSLPTPTPTGKLSVLVFEDDFPLNGEQDGGGGLDVLSPNEPGLGGFNIVLWDTYGGLGDVTGQDTYDMFNQPLSNSLAGTIDPATGWDACPISPVVTANVLGGDGSQAGITGMIVTCPTYESDGQTLSPLAGQAVIANLMPEKFSVQAYPGADRIARGEEWLQTNTLDGQHPHDSFIRIGEPSYFQEFGPAGYHVSIGFANPAIINARHNAVCSGAYGAVGDCGNIIKGEVDVQRLSRTPDQRLYPSGSRDALIWTQCWVSLGDPDAEDFMFTKCDANGNFVFQNVPGGNWRLTIGDQWNDQIIDGLSTAANVGCVPDPTAVPPISCIGLNKATVDLGHIGVQQWQSNLYTKICVDDNRNGICDVGEIGVPQVWTRIYYRDGHNSNGLTSDPNGVANFNETFPLFNWYVVEADTTRYKTTGIHTVYDAGGPADGSQSCGGSARPCGSSTGYNFLANTYEALPLPADLSVPGAVYCQQADCAADAATYFSQGLYKQSTTDPLQTSTGRIDAPWMETEGWSGLTSQGNWIEWAKAPYASNETGPIHGEVAYVSTRPFDSAAQMVKQPWEPNIPHVTVNLYQEGFAADNVTPTLTLVDTTTTSSWDDWAQGFWPGATAGAGSQAGSKPYMSCPGQGLAPNSSIANQLNPDVFFFTLYNQPNYLDWYNAEYNGGTLHQLPYNSQYKCYDAMHIWNQTQPAPYDGEYSFPSSIGIDPTTGKPATPAGVTPGVKRGNTFVASSMAGTNCTICVPNPDSSDLFRFNTSPMLPAGKYVVEVVPPPGFEIYKEEDKNLLIGDNMIGPVTVQFPGLGGDVFIMPDQANVASLYDPNGNGYNPNNAQNATTGLSLTEGTLSGVPGVGPGFTDELWPCVGEMRVVPDYLSLFPQALEVAPFAGAVRPLCDRKEVTLSVQRSANAKFSLFTSTHIASKFTGVITDDLTAEFDPFAPQFGEKYSPPNMPVSTKDYLGNEISRVHSDHWGIYDGLTYSSWDVNPPNITGYAPTMFVQCMNDPGPIAGPNGAMITDPLFNPAYSNFCYEEPYMPGLTTYLDTPVVPTQAFVGAGYNNTDCSYPDATPAIAEVDGDQIGPWVSAAGKSITITALGPQTVNNYAYSGPSATQAPFNQKTITRTYSFGGLPAGCTLGGAACNNLTIGGVPAVVTTWNTNTIVATVPPGVPACQIQQQAEYGGPGTPGVTPALCGQLVITAANGKQSVDTVTVTVGGKAPTHVPASGSIQSAIDGAAPGDLIIVDPTCTAGGATTICSTAGVVKSQASHTEMLIMWKPVRLQGVGAATTIVNANTHPAGKLLDPWRRHINCLFGLTLQGVPSGNTTPFDPSGTYQCPDAGWNYFVAHGQTVSNGTVVSGSVPQIDRLPLEAVIGWDATQNGNLAEQLQEPSLMGAYEGAGITVLAKGLDFHGQSPWNDGTETGALPAATTLLSGVVFDPSTVGPLGLQVGDNNRLCLTATRNGRFTTFAAPNPFPSNFVCNPSSIDGLSFVNSSQGGGGIFAHGWAHFLQIANNRVYNNVGTLSGGISVGQGEFPTPYLVGSATNAAPGSCEFGFLLTINEHMPYCLQLHTNVHNNYISNNASLGDELFSATLSGGGGISFCTGNDYYKFNYNWVCGNLSSGEGGGLTHLGEIFNGDIEHNSILFNQSSNPTIVTNGGGIMIQGTPDTDPTCPGVADTDCPPGLSDGTGPGLMINANLIQGNSADSGSGGGIRLQQVNGTEVSTFYNRPNLWHDVTITNNIIANNVAGWDGAGISLQDALNVKIMNNTITHNDTLASSGVLTQSIGTPMASAPAGNCVQAGSSASCPQSAGVTSTPNSSLLSTTFNGLPGALQCPTGQSGCAAFSNPLLVANLLWQNRSFNIGITGPGQGQQNQQNLVDLFSAFSNNASSAFAQTATGGCSTNVTYWDLGVRGDMSLNGHESGFQLNPTYSVLTNAGGYDTSNMVGTDPAVIRQYCNGSRVPPECSTSAGCGGPRGFGVPPGISDAVTPNPVFSLTPSATVDEGNNWINVSWGPLSTVCNSATCGTTAGGDVLGNYSLQSASQAVNYIPCDGAGSNSTTCVVGGTSGDSAVMLPRLDFFGNRRPDASGGKCADVGAVELTVTSNPNRCGFEPPVPVLTGISPTFGVIGNTNLTVTLSGTGLSGATAVNVSGGGVTATVVTSTNATVTATFNISRNAAQTLRTVSVTTPGGTSNTENFRVEAASISFTAPTLTTAPPNTATKTSVVVISNAPTANVAPLTITTIGVTKNGGPGTAGGTFSLIALPAGYNAHPACVVGPLAPGSSCAVNVQYVPGAAGVATRVAHISLGNSSGANATPLTSPNFNAN